VVVEAAGFLEDVGEFDAARPHVVDVRRRRGVAVLEGAFLPGLAPEALVVAVGVGITGWKPVPQIPAVHTARGQLAELIEAVAAVPVCVRARTGRDDARVEQR
jgi:hypothetical protein